MKARGEGHSQAGRGVGCRRRVGAMGRAGRGHATAERTPLRVGGAVRRAQGRGAAGPAGAGRRCMNVWVMIPHVGWAGAVLSRVWAVPGYWMARSSVLDGPPVRSAARSCAVLHGGSGRPYFANRPSPDQWRTGGGRGGVGSKHGIYASLSYVHSQPESALGLVRELHSARGEVMLLSQDNSNQMVLQISFQGRHIHSPGN